jgi:hypothetical protein
MSLSDLARYSGISASQLSRIERGQGGKSAVFGWHPDYLAIELQDRLIAFTHPSWQMSQGAGFDLSIRVIRNERHIVL